MPDNVLRVGAEFDVSPIVAGAQGAVAAFDKVQASAAKMAAQLIADGESFTAASAALVNFGFSAKTVAAAMESLGISEKEVAAATEEATASMTGFERAAALAGGRILGMEAGMGMAGGAIARVASYLPGLGTLFIYALPVALVADIVEKIEEYEAALQKASRELHEFATSSDEMTTSIEKENLKLEDQILKLERRPERNTLQLALIDAQEAAEKLSKSLYDAQQKSNDLLERSTGFFGELYSLLTGGGRADESQYAKQLQNITDQIELAREHLAELPPSGAGIKEALAEQIALYAQLKVALENDVAQMQAGEGSSHIFEKSIADFNEWIIEATGNIKNLTLQMGQTNLITAKGGLEDYAAHIKNIEEQVGKIAALNTEINDTKNKIAELSTHPILNEAALASAKESLAALTGELDKTLFPSTTKLDEELAKDSEKWKKYFVDQVAEAKKSSDERAKIEEEGSKSLMEQTDRAYAEMVSSNIEQTKAEATQIEEIYRKMGEQRTEASTGHTGVFAGAINSEVAMQQMQQLNVEMEKTDELIKRVQADAALIANEPFISNADQTQLQKYNEEIKSLQGLLQQLENEHAKLAKTAMTSWQQIERAEENALNKGFETFNSQFVRMMQTGQSFSKVMISAWNSMVGSFVTDVLKMGEQWIATEILKLTATTTTNSAITANTLEQNLIQRFDNAKTAAAKAMASTPFPLDLAVGPLVFAAALAFAEGGIVPGYGAQPAIVHGGERVLTGAQNQTLERIANSTTSNYGNTNVSMENHFHGAGSVSEAAIARNLTRGIRRGLIPMRGR